MVDCPATGQVYSLAGSRLGRYLEWSKADVAFADGRWEIDDIERVAGAWETGHVSTRNLLVTGVEEVQNPFVKLGIQMAIDGSQPEIIEDILRTEDLHTASGALQDLQLQARVARGSARADHQIGTDLIAPGVENPR